MGYGYWSGFAPYVSKAEKIRRAEQACAKLMKKGVSLEPVRLDGKLIAKTWWGKAWAQNLERYADYSNRIPRGRTYVRSGAVLDLKIAPNTVTALVSGSSPQPYKIRIDIKSLDKKNEKDLMEKSRASLDSMQALLSGEFPADLKEEFFRQGTGLFPSPKEIKLDCSCPDWADMCKHVAAALYGTAARLDEKPELFFTLRGITITDFVGTMVKQASEKMLEVSRRTSERAIAADDDGVSALFGITMDGAGSSEKNLRKTGKPVRSKQEKKKRVKSVEVPARNKKGVKKKKKLNKTTAKTGRRVK